MWVKRAAYRQFSKWMDRQLAELVARWAQLGPLRAWRFKRPIPRSKKG